MKSTEDLRSLAVPRWFIGVTSELRLMVHVFTDASSYADGAVVYITSDALHIWADSMTVYSWITNAALQTERFVTLSRESHYRRSAKIQRCAISLPQHKR